MAHNGSKINAGATKYEFGTKVERSSENNHGFGSPKDSALDELSRRTFIKASSGGLVAGVAATVPGALGAAEKPIYPRAAVLKLSEIAQGSSHRFVYPDPASPAILLRLPESAPGGVGPQGDIVAFSLLCTHKGCPVNYQPQRQLLICPCHWSTFDPAKQGQMVIGQASQALPQIALTLREDETIEAVGINGLIYGRHTNLV